MKSQILSTLAVAGLLFLAVPVFAADYSSYSLQELSQMRGTMMEKSQEEKAAFRNAWRDKMQKATAEERSLYARGRGKGGCNGSGNCNGSGSGHGHGWGHK